MPASSYYTDGTNTGRFTNGLNYADRLADSFGLTLTPSTPPIGGNNYAHGGARSNTSGAMWLSMARSASTSRSTAT